MDDLLEEVVVSLENEIDGAISKYWSIGHLWNFAGGSRSLFVRIDS